MPTIQEQITQYRAEAAERRAMWLANKDKTDRTSRALASDAAEKLEFATNKIAMLDAMAKSGKF